MANVTAVEPDSRWVDINGVHLHYLDWADPKATPVILLHGARSHAHTWNVVAQALLPEFRTLALDQRGHGDSGGAGLSSIRRGEGGPGDMVSDIGYFADALGLDRFHLGGISMGGLNSMAYAAQYPDRVDKLIVVDAGPVLSTDGLKRISRSSLEQSDVFDSPEHALAEARRLWPADPPMDEEAEKALRRRTIYNVRRRDDGKWTYKYDHDPASDKKVAAEVVHQADNDPAKVPIQPGQDSEERWEAWRKIEAPTLVVRGGVSDILTVEVADRMIAENPNARLVTVAGAGHSVTVYKGHELAAEMRSFLLAPG
jgi:pimeloyl-ACP methyl ester carboxylesterase